MLKKTELREVAYNTIRALQRGSILRHQELYRLLEKDFAKDCALRGDAAKEPRYRNDARWAVQDAKRDKLIEPTNERGQFRRI
jgi:hypothetical protein